MSFYFQSVDDLYTPLSTGNDILSTTRSKAYCAFSKIFTAQTLHLPADREPTVANERIVVVRVATSRVALKIKVQADNIVEPKRWKV